MVKRYLTASEAAEILRTSTGTLANRRMRGVGPRFLKFKKKILYDVHDLEDWMERHKVITDETRLQDDDSV